MPTIYKYKLTLVHNADSYGVDNVNADSYEVLMHLGTFVKGDPGEPFRYEDFTPEQLESLRGPQGISGGLLFPSMNFDAETGYLTIRGLQQEVERISYDEETAELVVRM